MMGRRRAVVALMVLLLLLCHALAVASRSNIVDDNSATLYLPSGGVSYQTLLTAEQRTATPVPFVLWRQQARQAIATQALGRTSSVAVVTVYGDSSVVLPSLSLLLPSSKGCLLDSQSCYQLFGDSSPLGEVVTLEDIEYIITGVFEHPEPMMVVQGLVGGGSECDRVTLALHNTPNPTQATEDFSQRHGLSPHAVLSGDMWVGFAEVMLQLPLLAILGMLLWCGLRLAVASRATPVFAAIIVCASLTLAAILWQLCGLGFDVPTSLIPSRWSDFAFWTTTFADISQRLWWLLTLPKELPQAMALVAALRCIAWSMGAMVLLVCGTCLCGRAFADYNRDNPTA